MAWFIFFLLRQNRADSVSQGDSHPAMNGAAMQPKRQNMPTTSNIIEIRSQAFDIIKRKSFIREKITLSSGQVSDHYFDMKPSMLDPAGASLLCELVLHRIGDIKVDYVGGLEMGAVPLIAPLAMISGLKGRPIPGFFVRKAPKPHGTQKQIEGVDDLEGKSVVVVDDVTTTGKSAMKSIDVLKAAGAKIALVLSILDRQEGAVALYADAGIPFQSLFKADEFLNS
jgi:orotate phosphoribosyltransferase